MKFKNVFIGLLVLLLIFMVIGCGNSAPRINGLKLISVEGEQSEMSVKTVSRELVLNSDGWDSKFNASTIYWVGQTGRNLHRKLYLHPADADGNPINVPSGEVINFNHDFISSEVTYQANILEIQSNAVGVHTVTAEYQGYTSVNQVIVAKRLITGDQRYCGCSLKLSDYNETSENPDITSSYSARGDKSYYLSAPNGIAVIDSRAATYLDRDIRQAFFEIATVPDRLDYQTSITIPADTSVIVIAKDAAGGYAKIFFGQGENSFYQGLGTLIEYIAPGQTKFTLHY